MVHPATRAEETAPRPAGGRPARRGRSSDTSGTHRARHGRVRALLDRDAETRHGDPPNGPYRRRIRALARRNHLPGAVARRARVRRSLPALALAHLGEDCARPHDRAAPALSRGDAVELARSDRALPGGRSAGAARPRRSTRTLLERDLPPRRLRPARRGPSRRHRRAPHSHAGDRARAIPRARRIRGTRPSI